RISDDCLFAMTYRFLHDKRVGSPRGSDGSSTGRGARLCTCARMWTNSEKGGCLDINQPAQSLLARPIAIFGAKKSGKPEFHAFPASLSVSRNLQLCLASRRPQWALRN